ASSRMHAQVKAVASSTLSAFSETGSEEPDSSRFLICAAKASLYSVRPAAIALIVIGGTLCADHLRQYALKLSTPGPDRPSSSANSRATAGDCSSHCSRSSPSYARTSFHSPDAIFVSRHFSLPFHFLAVTEI